MKPITVKPENLTKNELYHAEWLVTNGIGGYACGSVLGAPSRRHHSLLNASLATPYGRTVMLNYAADTLILPDKSEVRLSSLRQRENDIEFEGVLDFQLVNGIPIWLYTFGDVVIKKTLFLIHRQNTVHISYKLLSQGEGVELKWRPFFHFRPHEAPVDVIIPNESYTVHSQDSKFEIECPGFPLLNISNFSKASFTIDSQILESVYYDIEANRGYPHYGALKSPGFFSLPLSYDKRISFIASTETWNKIEALSPKNAWQAEKMRKRSLLRTQGSATIKKLFLAADQFLITPISRFDDMVRMQAMGEEVCSIIAGYPWFTDWGRDTMISFEGLTLSTGRHRDAEAILHTFAHYIRNGLIPNMFPDGQNNGIYNTADATLWFFHAIDRYITVAGDEDILESLIPKLQEVIEHHIKGTDFGIRMDADGLLIQGCSNLQLTWMDAKVGDWVVTPRRGKAVEINALWYNVLKLYEKWTGKDSTLSDKCYESFNQKFWYEEGSYLYDVIEGENGNDNALRPNQLFAISLSHPVLEKSRWEKVLKCVKEDLYTPVGLRTLSPHHPDYKTTYDGDLRARDAAYHQGTVWPWLLGHYIDVWLKIYPNDFASVQEMLKGLESHLNNHCIGTIAEIFDASPPYLARGCFAQAWSVAEVLRSYMRLESYLKPKE